MDRSRFYELIDEARPSPDPAAPSADPAELREVLERLDDDELIGFAAAFARELVRLNRWEIWGAGYAALGPLGGIGDDGFHYFRCWIIGKGADAVDTALEDPDGLADHLGEEEGEDLLNEELEYVATELLEDRGIDAPEAEEEVDGHPAGDEFDEDLLERDYPRLSAWADGGA